MKRLIVLLLTAIMLFTAIGTASAASNTETRVFYEAQSLGDGFAVTSEIVIHETLGRASTKTATNTKTFTHNGNVIAIIAITGTFSYNGTSSSVVSKSISRLDTYSGWKFTQTNFSSEGGAIGLVGELDHLLYKAKEVSLSLICDQFGNISQ